MKVITMVYEILERRLDELHGQGKFDLEILAELKKINNFAMYLQGNLKLKIKTKIDRIINDLNVIEMLFGLLESTVTELEKAVLLGDRKEIIELEHEFLNISQEISYVARYLILNNEKRKNINDFLNNISSRFRKIIDSAQF